MREQVSNTGKLELDGGTLEYRQDWKKDATKRCVHVARCRDAHGDLVIPATIDGWPVVGIDEDAFSGCNQLKTLVVPDSVKAIGRSAFGGCTMLTDCRLPDGLKRLESSMFESCRSLTSVRLPPQIKVIGETAFSGCAKLTDIIIPEGVTKIEQGAFEGCSALKSITLPKSVIEVDRDAFGHSVSLESFTVAKENPVYKSENGFLLTKDGKLLVCAANGDVVVPEGVVAIDDGAFEGRSGLKSIVFPTSLRHIGARAFKECSSLTRVTIPRSVEKIERDAFALCDKLSDVDIEIPDEDSVSGWDYDYDYVKDRVVKKLITPGIEQGAFYKCPFEIRHSMRAFFGGSRGRVEKIEDEKIWEHVIVGKYPEGYAVGKAAGEYLVIDVSSGPKSSRYPIEYRDEPPIGGWSDEFKVDKIVFRLITPGVFSMGGRYDVPSHQVKLTHPYYLAIFPLTNGQWLKIMGGTIRKIMDDYFQWDTFVASWFTESDKKSVRFFAKSGASFGDVRSEITGKEWPKSAEVSTDCLVGALRRRTGICNIDLPTEAEWEFACKTRGYYPYSEHYRNDEAVCGYGKVGCGIPNGWGLYDMGSGNVWEYCIDRYAEGDTSPSVNPTGGTDVGKRHVLKGGWSHPPGSSAADRIKDPGFPSCESGIRLCITLETEA